MLIENLEPVSARECSIPLPDDMRVSVDIDWFNDPEIGPELASALWSVYEGRYQEEHYYVSTTSLTVMQLMENGMIFLRNSSLL